VVLRVTLSKSTQFCKKKENIDENIIQQSLYPSSVLYLAWYLLPFACLFTHSLTLYSRRPALLTPFRTGPAASKKPVLSILRLA
jgi:hypothetical protein